MEENNLNNIFKIQKKNDTSALLYATADNGAKAKYVGGKTSKVAFYSFFIQMPCKLITYQFQLDFLPAITLLLLFFCCLLKRFCCFVGFHAFTTCEAEQKSSTKRSYFYLNCKCWHFHSFCFDIFFSIAQCDRHTKIVKTLFFAEWLITVDVATVLSFYFFFLYF